MMFSGTLQMRCIGPARRRAGKSFGGDRMAGGDYVTLPGLFWRPGSRPQRANLIIFGSDFQAIESIDYSKRPVVTASNVFPVEPYVELIDGKITSVVHRFLVARGSIVTVMSYGGALLASHQGRDEKGDGRRVDREGQGNNMLELLVNDLGKAVDSSNAPKESPPDPSHDGDWAPSSVKR